MSVYTEEKLMQMSVHTLRVVLRTEFNGVPGVCNKSELIDQILSIQAGGKAPSRSTKGRKPLGRFITPIDATVSLADEAVGKERVRGLVELCDEGYANLKVKRGSGTFTDCFIPRILVSRYSMCSGDEVDGEIGYEEGNKLATLQSVHFINGKDPVGRMPFDFLSLSSQYPTEKLSLDSKIANIRAVDEFCPIGKGQRCIIEDCSGKFATDFVNGIASSLRDTNLHVFFITVGVKPEALNGLSPKEGREVMNLPIGADTEEILRSVNVVVERAKILTALGNDVVIVIDSLSYLANVYEEYLSVDKRHSGFIRTNLTKNGYAREIFSIGGNFGENKSLTVIATFKTATEEKMLEELVSTATSVIRLKGCDALERRGYVVDLINSYTEKDELLLTKEQIERADCRREGLAKDQDYLVEIYKDLSK
ncbi:MAG: hypothetical protein IKA61_00165 [Clostridia bacterium]|nr:hypothetical protein [Clostridia bacterium]